MDAWLEYQRVYNNNIRRAREYEERRNWDRYHNLLQILNETHTCPYDHLSGNTRGRAHLREDVVRAHLVQGFMLLTSLMFNFDRPWSNEENFHVDSRGMNTEEHDEIEQDEVD